MPVSLVYRHRHADGGFRWVESWISNKVDEPAIGGVVVNLRDVTARVEATQALRESEERYRAIVETAQEGIWVVSPQGRTTYVNQKVADMTGRTLEELHASRLTDLLDTEEGYEVLHSWRTVVLRASTSTSSATRTRTASNDGSA